MSVQQFNKNHNSTQPAHIYYDMNLINNDSSFPGEPVRFQYKETRSNDFLLCPQDYFMSIVRFNLQTPTLPVFIPQINLNANTNNGSIYPIVAMNNNLGDFTLRFYGDYTNVIPVGAVIYLNYNAPDPNVAPPGDTSATGLQYCRISEVRLATFVEAPGVLFTLVSLLYLNGTTITGTTTNYPAGVKVGIPTLLPWKGATQNMNFAVLPIDSLAFLGTLLTLTCTTATVGTLPVGGLRLLYQADDTLFIQNAGNYNGRYRIKDVTPTTITLYANSLTGVVLSQYLGGGQFKSIGDYQNLTPYTMTMTWIPIPSGGASTITYTSTMPVVYRPADSSVDQPIWNPSQPQALTLQDITSPYYFVFSYANWVDMLNTAMTNCFYALQGFATNGVAGVASANQYIPSTAKVNSLQTTMLLFQPPSVSWDEGNLKYIITADNEGFNTSGINPVLFYLNSPLSTVMDSFPYNYPNVDVTSPLYSQLMFDFNTNAGAWIVTAYNSVGAPVTNGQYLGVQIYQNHQTASLLNPIQSIVFTSTLLPVTMENVGLPLILNGTSTTQTVIGSSANIFPIVTDFIVPFSATNGYVPDITYTPAGEYRLVDMYGSSPCKSIDIQVFWKDLYGILHPFFVGSGCSGSLKVMFRRKDYNNIDI